ncbi:hypothetical protein BDQ94DRAFT_164321 [Aspergillus welwitschiae]|uniref:Uncharacterized protein n=2 Tax=Aspergillus subgen. Circumdati TaxID=2720871 RepID=A0A3F3PIR5_9EURO|nr:hypothetical protein BDQ94DRAFT_164321 [Aspergillus welwitschiae]OJZ80222.1 hypothetical protein ASPFODRAFT_53713 [Aspergillus luchuensis CBS 106.47]RDH26632.1 hypothetical protein BDQ94DRAFT_164321 [Aspergillus welwitschiae]
MVEVCDNLLCCGSKRRGLVPRPERSNLNRTTENLMLSFLGPNCQADSMQPVHIAAKSRTAL